MLTKIIFKESNILSFFFCFDKYIEITYDAGDAAQLVESFSVVSATAFIEYLSKNILGKKGFSFA